MADVIRLLPDNVANQIAAGEVVQRPANAIKELIENAIDAKATNIKIFVKDGGIALLKIIDNGCGMSETDARMCWERHATSKIIKAADLFTLHTYGFRGEALASIAAVSMVEMVTKREIDDVACKIVVHGSVVKMQELAAGPVGTSISISNLFYNLPARRNFLKSISVETKYIIEEVQNQALAHANVEFELYNQDKETFKLKTSSSLNRFADILVGIPTSELIEFTEKTNIVEIYGILAKPNKAKRTRGQQYLFANERFIKSAYLNHAVTAAFEGLISVGSFPVYAIFIKVHASKIDVNIHPTKTEVKFEDEKHIYSILKAAVRKAVGNFVIQPNMPIEGLTDLESLLATPFNRNIIPDKNAGVLPLPKGFNPFNNNYDSNKRHQDWQKILGDNSVKTNWNIDNMEEKVVEIEQQTTFLPIEIEIIDCFRIKSGFIVANINGNLVLINPNRAQKRILYERFLENLLLKPAETQQLLFPQNIELNAVHMPIFHAYQDSFKKLGFDISHFGGNCILVNGLPSILIKQDYSSLIIDLMEELAIYGEKGDEKIKDTLAKQMANALSTKNTEYLSKEQQISIVTQLFNCKEPQYSPSGNVTMINYADSDMLNLFKRK